MALRAKQPEAVQKRCALAMTAGGNCSGSSIGRAPGVVGESGSIPHQLALAGESWSLRVRVPSAAL
jgi:hypothetical protein